MSQDREQSIEEYRTELSESVDDGGGCAEAWEALSAERNSSRRGFLTATVATMFVGSGTAAAERGMDVELDADKTITELDQQEEDRLVEKALGSDKLNSTREQLRSHGLRPDQQNVSAYRSTYKGKEWRFVRVPFTSEESSRATLDSTTPQYKGAVVWNTLDEISPYGYLTTKEVVRGGEVSPEVERALENDDIDISSLDTVPVKVTNTVIGPDEHDNSDSLVFPVTEEQSGVSTQNDCACTALFGSPLTACAPCGTPDIDCISDLVNNYAVEIVACGACAVSRGWLTKECATCVATILEEDNYDAFCCWCDAIDL